MSDVQTACPDLRTLCESVQTAQMNAARALLRDLASSVASANGILQGLPDALRAGRAESYMRHIAYADPHGAFTIAYLVWRQGQFSPCMATRPGAPIRFCRASCPKPTTAGTRASAAIAAAEPRAGRATSSRPRRPAPDPQAGQRQSRSRHLAAHLRRRSGRYLQRRESSDRQGAGRVAQALIPPNAFLAQAVLPPGPCPRRHARGRSRPADVRASPHPLTDRRRHPAAAVPASIRAGPSCASAALIAASSAGSSTRHAFTP